MKPGGTVRGMKHNGTGQGAVLRPIPVRITAVLGCLLGAAFLLGGLVGTAAAREEKAQKQGYPETLMQIYKEVKELGPYPGQDFIRWDFHMGQGDDDTNKPLQAVVLIQNWEQGERMAILVSRLEASPASPNVYWNQGTKEITCRIKDNKAELVSSEYKISELEALLPQLLLAIKDKKNLLKR